MRKISAFKKYSDPTICHEQVVYLNDNGIDKQTVAKSLVTRFQLSRLLFTSSQTF